MNNYNARFIVKDKNSKEIKDALAKGLVENQFYIIQYASQGLLTINGNKYDSTMFECYNSNKELVKLKDKEWIKVK